VRPNSSAALFWIGLQANSLGMWEQITKADIHRARTELRVKRAETLRRHAEELSDLDAQCQDVEQFERIVAAFFEEYLSSEETSSGLEQKTSALGPPGEQPNMPVVSAHSADQVSPDTAVPPRLRRASESLNPWRRVAG
jgi:hypothetical protein